MPLLIEYPTVLATLEPSGLKCVYPNSGAFAPTDGATHHMIGWITAEDPTIRKEVRSQAKLVTVPLESLVIQAWQKYLRSPMWLMPASHWAYELQFGAADWLPKLLQSCGIDQQPLRSRSDGSAVEFQLDEAATARSVLASLLSHLTASDFTLAFPSHAAVATLHHHRQVWWQISDRELSEQITSVSSAA